MRQVKASTRFAAVLLLLILYFCMVLSTMSPCMFVFLHVVVLKPLTVVLSWCDSATVRCNRRREREREREIESSLEWRGSPALVSIKVANSAPISGMVSY